GRQLVRVGLLTLVVISVELNRTVQFQTTKVRSAVLDQVAFAGVIGSTEVLGSHFEVVGDFINGRLVSGIVGAHPDLTELVAFHTDVGSVKGVQTAVASLVIGVEFQLGLEEALAARCDFVVVLHTDGGAVVVVTDTGAALFNVAVNNSQLDVTVNSRQVAFLGQRGAGESGRCNCRCDARLFHVASSFLS